MIGFLKGRLLDKTANQLLIDVAGVGYRAHISFATFFTLGAVGSELALFIHTHVREDALVLFGFATALEQRVFERLISVTGIGPRMAITILSGIPADDLSSAIRGNDVQRLTAVPGVGKKTAERLILELKDKFDDVVATQLTPRQPSAADLHREDAISALVNLGYRQRDAELALDRVRPHTGSLEDVLKAALGAIAR